MVDFEIESRFSGPHIEAVIANVEAECKAIVNGAVEPVDSPVSGYPMHLMRMYFDSAGVSWQKVAEVSGAPLFRISDDMVKWCLVFPEFHRYGFYDAGFNELEPLEVSRYLIGRTVGRLTRGAD